MEALIAGLAAAWCAIAVAIHIGSAAATRLRSVRAAGRPDGDLPPVSVLVPVKGREPDLEGNLHALCRQDYPDHEIVVAVADRADPAYGTAERVVAAHPGKVRITLGRDPVSAVNPKVETLAPAFRASSRPLVVHCDANVRLEPWRLRQAVEMLDDDTGIVSAAFVGTGPGNLAATVECAFLNGYHARLLTGAAVVGHAHAEGKFMLYRRADLEAGGGFGALGGSVSDEAALERVMHAQGRHVRLMPLPVAHPVGRRRFGAVWRRQLRWMILRRTAYPGAVTGEIAIGGAAAFASAAAAAALLGLSPALAVLGVAAVWYAVEAILVATMRWPLSAAAPPAWMLRDLLLVPALFASLPFVRRFDWRGETIDRAAHAFAPAVASRAQAPAPVATEGRAQVRVLVHIFYPDLWPELAAYIANLAPGSFRLHVNIVDRVATPDLVADITTRFPGARIRHSPNRGRDIGGFFALLADAPPRDDEIVCLLHTKRSPHMILGGGTRWRRGLLDPLLGTPRQAAENVAAMKRDPTIGMIGARRFRTRRLTANRERFEELLDRFGIRGKARHCEFVAGTMMFVRGSVLRQLQETLGDLAFEDGDHLALREHLDGQIAHAVERVIGSLVRHLGLHCRWR